MISASETPHIIQLRIMVRSSSLSFLLRSPRFAKAIPPYPYGLLPKMGEPLFNM